MDKIIVLLAAVFWAASGIVAQYLFSISEIKPAELTIVRMLLSGALFLLSTLIPCFRIQTLKWTSADRIWRIPLFGMLGIYFMQYTYFESIYWGNAATATVLQYTAPIVIIIVTAIQRNRTPNITETIATISAVIGVFLLVSGGEVNQLLVPLQAITWGLISAFALAFYTVFPKELLKRVQANFLLGMGMLLGGTVGYFIEIPIRVHLFFEPMTNIWITAFIVLFGTFFPFFMYLEALKTLSPTTVSIIACIEPFAAVLFSVAFLHTHFGLGELLGVLGVVLAIGLITLSKEVQD